MLSIVPCRGLRVFRLHQFKDLSIVLSDAGHHPRELLEYRTEDP